MRIQRVLVATLVGGSLLLVPQMPAAAESPRQSNPSRTTGVRVHVQDSVVRLLSEEDTDGDLRITVDDRRGDDSDAGDARFILRDASGRGYEVAGTYYLSNLLQELTLAGDAPDEFAALSLEKIFENPVDRISRTIRTLHWQGLTRSIGAAHLQAILPDDKTPTDDRHYLYVPHDDRVAYEYFARLSSESPVTLTIVRLPETITADYVTGLEGQHGLLSLALREDPETGYRGVPFVVPGGRFNEMYGWDSYFIVLGLLQEEEEALVDLAKSMVDNFVYQIQHYGKILNANRSYYLTRSQPPFLTSMALAIYEHSPRTAASRSWLAQVMRMAIKEYGEVWMHADRLTPTGLSRYYGGGVGPPPEVEPHHFDAIYEPYAEARGLSAVEFERRYKAGQVDVPELDTFFVHDRCVRESGHDTTYRWDWAGDRCADFVTVDLNALLYKTELDIAATIRDEFGGTLRLDDGEEERASSWDARAAERKGLILEYLWDDERGMFFDYDLKNERRQPYVSATTLYPLWAVHVDDPTTRLVTDDQARRLVEGALPLLEEAGGLAASSEDSRGAITESRPLRQWDYPHGWAPHQMLAWRGLSNYGFATEAERLAYRWLYAITRNAVDYNGTIPEKLDVVQRSHEVFAEYGNVGTDFAYITREGFAWMNASYQVGLALLPAELERSLRRLVPPEWIFVEAEPEP